MPNKTTSVLVIERLATMAGEKVSVTDFIDIEKKKNITHGAMGRVLSRLAARGYLLDDPKPDNPNTPRYFTVPSTEKSCTGRTYIIFGLCAGIWADLFARPFPVRGGRVVEFDILRK